MSKPTLQKIVFNVRGKTLELSKEEAKELRDILSDLFGEVKYVDRWNYWTYPYHYPPYSSSGAITGGTLPSGGSGITFTGNLPSNSTDTIYLALS